MDRNVNESWNIETVISISNLGERNAHCYSNSDHCTTPSVFNMANYQNKSYKSLHEAFVSNNTGTSPIELSVAVAVHPMACLCFQILYLFDCRCNKSEIFMFSVEFICVVILQIFILTLGADYCYQYCYALILLTIFLIALKLTIGTMNGAKQWPPNILNSRIVSPDNCAITFLTNIRAHLCLLVSICILAVDFPIFPRRFAKTEKYGYGLMDIGIGVFMVINGIVAPEAKPKYQFTRRKTKAMMKSIVSSVPLLLIGFLRIIFVKTLDYQEQVTEYGVHWNFFFSLTFAKIGCSFVFLFFRPVYSGIIAIAMSVYYQVLLQLGLDDIIINGFDGKDTRSNFFDANREGLASCVSFTCLYLTGIQMGYVVFRTGLALREQITGCGKCYTSILASDYIDINVLVFGYYFDGMFFTFLHRSCITTSSQCNIHNVDGKWVLTCVHTGSNSKEVLGTAFFLGVLLQWMIIDIVVVLLKYHSGPEDAKYYTAKPSIINNTMIANVLTGLQYV
uniref:Phosphatidylinositol-glycan biosynthesis class W protein n=1 Tax=Strigamia maritima TaxID=126957 RepID=T1J7G4_STRMM